MEVEERVAQLICSALPYSHRLISVRVADGHVVLKGDVDWSYQRDQAEAAVHDEPGVESVENAIAVRPAAGEAKRRVEEALAREQRPAAGSLLNDWAQPQPPAPASRA